MFPKVHAAENMGRSPHGERGLKYRLKVAHVQAIEVALLMESVD